MHPTVARSNRSSLQSSIPSTSTPSSILQHPPQQIQQQIIYGPIANPLVSLQPCGTGLHPSCIYPGTQRNAGLSSPIPLHMQGKNNRWPSKNKLLRHQQYCQQQQQQQQILQQQLPYTPKPIVLFDPSSNNGALPPSTTSFLVASSTFTHGPYPGEQYSNSGVTLIPQPYFKPPDVQTYCLVQDRQPNQQQQEQPSHDSYYNISATNTCSLQAVNANAAFQFPNLGPYASVAAFTNNQISGPLQAVQSTQIFPNPHVNLVYSGSQRERPSSLSTIDISTFKCTRKVPVTNSSQYAPTLRTENNNDWPAQVIASSSNSLFDLKLNSDEVNADTTEAPSQKIVSNVSNKTQEEHYSDESSASFDFTIEAEKMVSALCNTTSSNDLGKMEVRDNTSDSVPLFSGAGDTATNKSTWFTDLCTNYGTSKSIAIQTDGPCNDSTQYPELIRKAAYWGCTEAEILLNNNLKMDPRCGWLKNITSATKKAVTKSSTCFPIFAGDRVFVGDLINALLRICNGWLILDNYLNKQHYPSLNDKFDQELVRSFQMWEWNTYELLNQIIQSFLKLDESSEDSGVDHKPTELPGTSFPGDVSLYTNCDLFEPSSSIGNSRQQNSRNNNQEPMCNTSEVTSSQLSTGSLRNFRLCETNQQRQQQAPQKDTKLRSKWTVTENQTSTIDATKSVPDMFSGNTEAGSNTSSILRTRAVSSSCSRLDSSTQSLNAEFHHLRSKVLESNPDTSKERITKDKRQNLFERKVPAKTESFDSMLQSQRPLTHRSSENMCAQKYLPGVDSFSNPSSINLQSVYFATSTDTATGLESNYAVCTPYTIANCNAQNFNSFEQAYENKASNVDSVYVGKSSSNQLKLSAVPKDKMTLLSQIEPNIPDKPTEKMTANLSAWFASMRNVNEHRQVGSVPTKLPPRQEVSKNTIDLVRQLQIDTNRQLQTLQNMQSIQNAPWNACNLITNGVQVQQGPDEYDSSEDVRVYMKPGSYNVPKKRHQRRSNRRLDNSSVSRNGGVGGHRNYYSGKEKTICTPASSTPVPRTTISSVSANSNSSISAAMKLPFPETPIARPPVIFLENSSGILKHVDSPSNEVSRDITWKTACASAEILLEALNVKEDASVKSYKEIHSNEVTGERSNNESNNVDGALQAIQNQEKSQESLSKASKHAYDDCAEASSYEASEDDSGSTSRLSHNASYVEISQSSDNKNGSNKTNVKTDSWLIRTLNNASIVSKQKRRKNNNNRHSSESSNSSVAENEQEIPTSSLAASDAANTVTTKTMIEKHQPIAYSSENVSTPMLKDNHISTEESERVVGKATYSETVRRSAPLSTSYTGKKEFSKKSKLNLTSTSTICSTMVPIPGRRCQRRDPERSYHILHKSRKSSSKKTFKMCDSNDPRMEERAGSKSRVTRNETTKENLCVVSTITSKLTSTKSHGKKKENLNGSGELLGNKFPVKSSDRGWSVWYSSKRKQSLSPLALSKLEMIHQTVWKMEEAQVFKSPSPSSNFSNQSTSTDTIEDYCKVIKSPMFLETVGYKLKNRAYHKVEHVVGDFRRIVHNSKLYHKDDHDRVTTIDNLSKKLEQLFEEHFSSWDFGNISGSPREASPISHRLKSMEQKPVAGCYGNTKKALPPLSPQKTYHFGDIYLSE